MICTKAYEGVKEFYRLYDQGKLETGCVLHIIRLETDIIGGPSEERYLVMNRNTVQSLSNDPALCPEGIDKVLGENFVVWTLVENAPNR